MVDHHNIGLHKFYARTKRLRRYKGLVDSGIFMITLFGIIMTIPQVVNIWVYKNAAGVSAVSWSAYTITALFWFFYGVVHKEKVIILTNVPWIFLNLLIVVGTVMYG